MVLFDLVLVLLTSCILGVEVVTDLICVVFVSGGGTCYVFCGQVVDPVNISQFAIQVWLRSGNAVHGILKGFDWCE